MRPIVWAPRASGVEVVTTAGRVPMTAGDHGWFRSRTDLAAGTRYAFAVDDAEPVADPMSRSQPDGSSGWSEIDDPAAFTWSDAHWTGLHLPGAVLYELHIGTFTTAGTFDSAIERLDDLVELGVDAVELMPVATFPGERGWGYDGVFWWAPHATYGGPDGLRRFVDAAHGRGLGVLLDVVYNHFGPRGAIAPGLGPWITEDRHTPWGGAINLDGPGSASVRSMIIDNALMWMRDHHIDGLRIDAVHALVDTSARHVLEELADEVRAMEAHLGRRLVLIAESDRNDPRDVLPPEAGGLGLDAVWSDDLHHALHRTLTGEAHVYYEDFQAGACDVARAIDEVFVRAGHSTARDQVRGRPAGGADRHRFVVCLQNHDQIGNRPAGERIAMLAPSDAVKVASALVLLGPFTPLLFQGEEWAASTPFTFFADFDDTELVEAVRAGRAREFAGPGWDAHDLPDPFADATFASCTLRWEERDAPEHRDMLQWYRSLIALRRAWPDLTDGRADRTSAEPFETCVMMRRGRLTVVANLGAEPVDVPVAPPPDSAVLLANGVVDLGDAAGAMRLAGHQVVVIGPSAP